MQFIHTVIGQAICNVLQVDMLLSAILRHCVLVFEDENDNEVVVGVCLCVRCHAVKPHLKFSNDLPPINFSPGVLW